MIEWALAGHPRRLVDPGCGSGRFVGSALRRQRDLNVVAIDVDPVATLITRALVAELKAPMAEVLNDDFTRIDLPAIDGTTAWVGNPPYVRHHELDPKAKLAAAEIAGRLGHRLSGLAGLHVHFFLSAVRQAKKGDALCYVTSAEWLDIGYGAILRHLYVDGLGGHSLTLLDPASMPFGDAMTTALIACAKIGSPSETIRLRRVQTAADLGRLDEGNPLEREQLASKDRWSGLFTSQRPDELDGGVTLGSLARVSRGIATGCNRYFVLAKDRAKELGLIQWCRPVISEAREIFECGGVVRDAPERKVLLCLPPGIDRSAHPAVDAYLASGELGQDGERPVSARHLCAHRRPWYSMGAPHPAPIVASYMARQAPRFAENPDGLLHVNIAHGLYPRRKMNQSDILRLTTLLNDRRDRFVGLGRTYQGGLEKFEPREMEALSIPWRPD
jgi:predicted RNA methylase